MSRTTAYVAIGGLLLLALLITIIIVKRMRSIPRYFKWSEFDSPDAPGSGQKKMNREFVAVLDAIREEVGFPLVINSGYRTPEHNAAEGGVEDSAHIYGLAADIRATDAQKRAIAKAAIARGIDRIGWGATFIHIDMDRTKPRKVVWSYGGIPHPSFNSLA